MILLQSFYDNNEKSGTNTGEVWCSVPSGNNGTVEFVVEETGLA